jgi:putative methyltransferase (TIGR04325 family)
MRMWRRPRQEHLPQDDRVRFEGDYASFEDALAACRGDLGYESDNAIAHYLRRYQAINADMPATITSSTPQLLPYMAALSLAEPVDGVIEVFDFGGGYGAIYDQLRFLYPGRALRWTVVELPRLVEHAAEMGASQWKRFAFEIPLRRYSLGIVSGAMKVKFAITWLASAFWPLVRVLG